MEAASALALSLVARGPAAGVHPFSGGLGGAGFDESRWQREVEPWGRDFDRLKNLIELCRGFLALTPEAIHAVQPR